MAYLGLRIKEEKLSFHLNIWKCILSVVVYLWSEIINTSMLTLMLTTSR